jgi:hypothetical protein
MPKSDRARVALATARPALIGGRRCRRRLGLVTDRRGVGRGRRLILAIGIGHEDGRSPHPRPSNPA